MKLLVCEFINSLSNNSSWISCYRGFFFLIIYCFLFLIGGVPGIGKTQLGYAILSFCSVFFFICICSLHLCWRSIAYIWIHRIQLAVNVQMPSYCGGLGGKAIYIGSSWCLLYVLLLSEQTFCYLYAINLLKLCHA